MVVKELRTKKNDELLALVDDLKAQLFMLRFKNSTGQLDQPHKIKMIKQDIARVFTILHQREQVVTTSQNLAKPQPAQSSKTKKATTDQPKPALPTPSQETKRPSPKQTPERKEQ